MAGLKLVDISKTYGKISVLRGINLTIKAGEFVVFVGPSGCGKSTLLRMIAGLEAISDGELYIDDQCVNDIPAPQRGIAMVFQSYALYPHMTVRENMSFALRIAKRTRSETNAIVERVAASLHLSDYLDRLPKSLSGGQRQRVAIGRAIVRDPRVYLFDEPLSNLDAALRVATRIEIAALKESMPNTTMIYVTHDQIEAMTLADRIVLLANQGIAQVGKPLDLYDRPANEFVARFIGSPSMNLFPGQIDKTGTTTTIRLVSGGYIVSSTATDSSQSGLSVNVGVRPEDMIVTEQTPALYTGYVKLTEALGEMTLLYLTQNEQDKESIIAKLQGTHKHMRHNHVAFTADPSKVHIFHKGDSLL